jgi:hypothetical protein
VSLSVLDPNGTPTENGFEDAFDGGILLGAEGRVTEVVVKRPVPALGVERLNRDQQFGEEAFQDSLQSRSRGCSGAERSPE